MTTQGTEEIVVTLDDLRELIARGDFDHATYRDFGKCWEGLNIYRRDPTGWGGARHCGVFHRGHPDLPEAERIVAPYGTSVGSRGNG